MKSIISCVVTVFLAFILAACGSKSTEEKIKEQVNEKMHALTDTERPLADANAKKFFEHPWITAEGQIGQFISCRPSDSNANGLVTCTGFIPQAKGGFAEVKRYCGYRPELVGCSDEDTVK